MINHASLAQSRCTTSWFFKTYSKSKCNVQMLYGHSWGSHRVEKHFSSVKMKLKWKDSKREVWYGFCLSQELSDNLLNCCFIHWDFADHVKTACRQLIFYLGNGFSVWSFLWIKFCSVLALVSFHLKFGRRGVVTANSCLCILLWTQKR